MKLVKIFSIISIFFSVFVASIIILAGEKTSVDDSAYKDILEKTIPIKIGKMQGKELPLGNTEEVIRASEKILFVSDFLNREYTTADNKKFTLYISYWVKNKMRITDSATHTPDRCWVKNGWTNHSEHAKIDTSLSVNGKKLKPAYSRVFSIKAQTHTEKRNVLYWFIADKKHYNFGKEKSSHIPNPFVWLKGALFVGSPEMYFVRIDSTHNIKELFKDKDFQKLLNYVGEIAIYEQLQ